MVRYDAATADIAEFPGLPKKLIKNPPQLLRALHDAGETTSPDSTRFSLGYLQLRGTSGTIAATDGRQLLVQGGFRFPWKEDVLIPHAKVFGSAELPQDQSVTIGKADDWVVVRVGPWTFFLSVDKDGRYPDIDRQIPQADNAVARFHLDPADAEFLGKSLPKLPCDDEYNFPVTVDLNGSVAIRAKGEMQSQPTELVLAHSTFSGEPIRINTNRKFLARALKLGFRELLVYGDKMPVLCQDERRQYLWALLAPDSAIKPADDTIRIESPSAGTTIPVNHPRTKRRLPPVPEPTANNGHAPSNGHAKANGQARNGAARKPGQDIDSLIRQAEALRTSLRDTLLKNNELLKGLKRHRRLNRSVQHTIASLRQLKGLGV